MVSIPDPILATTTARAEFESSFRAPCISSRVRALHDVVRATPPAVCSERARLVTDYFRNQRKKEVSIIEQKAEALAFVLANKKVHIYPDELLVGCFTSKRVGGGLFPELHGVAMLEDLYAFDKRSVNPLVVAPDDRRVLATQVLPYWGPRFLAVRAFSPLRALAFIRDQLSPTFYLINEAAGISHFVPNYRALLERGTSGLREEAQAGLVRAKGREEEAFFRAIQRVLDGLDTFADGYRKEALRLADATAEPHRKRELLAIANTCARVPRLPATSFRDALQSIVFAQIALNLESLDNSVSPGRLDRLLFPYYTKDLHEGCLTRDEAFEWLGCFAVKLCEIKPVLSRRTTRFHGGMFNGQVVVVGGQDEQGCDSTNELSHLFVELMANLRTRQPNYHARLHAKSPREFRDRVARVLQDGANSPALYNDDVIIPMLCARGIQEADARDYATVGCVEPVAAAKSFLSTDAALFNLPLCLELALNRGRRFGRWKRVGANTRAPESCSSIDEFLALLGAQIEFGVARLLRDLGAVERANARWHPTPLTSVLIEGCVDSGKDATSGGAKYNGSGIQGVGAVEVGEGLAAIDALVFRTQRVSMGELVRALKGNFQGAEALRARLVAAPKFGNDDPACDEYVGRAIDMFARSFEGKINARGGAYAAGFYSVTSHQAFGEMVGALPSGRLASQPFSSGLSPSHGMDRKGPTAALRSLGRLPLHRAQNGVNFNLTLAPWLVSGRDGTARMSALIDGGFASGCMQIQINVLDPKRLIEARDHPGRFPGLLVRVSGYSAYFDDLSPEIKQELIDRLSNCNGGHK